MPGVRSAILLIAALAAPLSAGPDLTKQGSWSDGDKKAFLKYLKSGEAAPVMGQVKDVTVAAGEEAPIRKARYMTLEMASDSIFTATAAGAVNNETSSIGPRLLVGGHIFTWMRYYTGLQYNSMSQERLDGSRSLVGHYQVPFGVEFALIPLGTPHTRYVLLRAGVTAHDFRASDDKVNFTTPLNGWAGSWNLGLGYEWQIHDSRWRLHALAEGYKSFLLENSARFYGVGATLGVAYTF